MCIGDRTLAHKLNKNKQNNAIKVRCLPPFPAGGSPPLGDPGQHGPGEQSSRGVPS